MIYEQEILEYKDGDTRRVLKVDYINNIILMIRMEGQKGIPEIFRLSEIEELLIDLHIVKITQQNKKLLLGENEVTDEHKRIQETRWNIIKQIIYKPQIYDKQERSELIKNLSKQYNVSIPTLYKWLRQYWRMGSCPNALLPLFDQCGRRGKIRKGDKKKRGAKRRKEKGVGINITEEEREKLERGYKQFYLNQNRNSLKKAWEETLRRYFSTKNIQDDGKVTISVDRDNCPTQRQFRYWGEKKYTEKERVIARKGEKEYRMNHRPILGETTHIMPMPGYIYQIDATKAQIDLVHEDRRDWIIGSVTMYLVVDQFSHLIVGFYVGLKDASWQDAAMALYWTQRPKKELCAEYGIEITEEMWPDSGLPVNLLADNGELASNYPINLTLNLGVEVTLAPAHRPEQKAIVESLINNLKNGEIKTIPAAREKVKKRGTRDTRKDAVLTVREFTQIVIREILYMNNKYMQNYVLDREMIRDAVKPIPLEIWKWAREKRMGVYKKFDDDVVKLNLMHSRDGITMSHKGILFQNGKYVSDELKEWGVYEALRGSSIKVKIYYDPRVMHYIYIKWDEKIIRLYDVYKATSSLFLEELELWSKEKESMDYEGEKHNQDERVLRASEVEQIVISAQDKSDIRGKSIGSRIKNLPEHRAHQEEKINQEQAFIIEKNEIKSSYIEEDYIPKRFALKECEDEYEY